MTDTSGAAGPEDLTITSAPIDGVHTITVRGEIANPILRAPSAAGVTVHELTDGEFVTVVLEGVQPVEVLAIPRSAVLSDQRGDYVIVVGADNKAEQRRIQLGQSTTTIAAVIAGLAAGDKVIAEGLQRVRPGQIVSPGPASPLILSSMKPAADAPAPQADHGASGTTRPCWASSARRRRISSCTA